MSPCTNTARCYGEQASRDQQQFQSLRPSAQRDKAQAELDHRLGAATGLHIGFHKLEFPVDERPSDTLISDLREHAREVFWFPERLRELSAVAERPDCPPHLRRYRGVPFWWPAYRKLVVITPSKPAVHIIIEQGWKRPNRAEVYLDYIFPTEREAADMREFFDRYGVQLRHGKRLLDAYGEVSYTGRPQPGRYAAAYSDSASTATGEIACCHIEPRFVGDRAVRDSLGIIDNADLLTFDFAAFRAKFERYEVVDLERLGRTHANRLAGARRRKPDVRRYGSNPGFDYNRDLRGGGFLWRALSPHPKLPLDSTQQFLDQYRFGRGPYLHRLDTHACTLTPYLW